MWRGTTRVANVWSSTQLLEFDFAGIEAVLLGWCMRRPEYLRLAKLGMHAYLASHVLKRPADLGWPDDQLAGYFREIKQAKDDPTVRAYNGSKRIVHGCVPPDHEVLTPAGWVRFDDLNESHEVAQWATDGMISFVKPLHFHKYPYAATLHTLKGRAISAEMTPGHRVPLQIMGRWYTRIVPDLHKYGRIPTSGVLNTTRTLPDDLIRLALAIQADGSYVPNAVVFHFTKARKILRLRTLLQNLRAEYVELPCGDHPKGRRFRVYRTGPMLEIEKWLLAVEGKQKLFRWESFLQFSQRLRRLIIDECQRWDGSVRGLSGQSTYVNTNEHNATVLQTLAHLSGLQALLRVSPRGGGRKPLYRVSFNRRTQARLETLEQGKKAHVGHVYCVTVPSGYFLIRHNGAISVTGNSGYGQTPMGTYLANPKLFGSLAAAQQICDTYFAIAPGLPAFHRAVRKTAYDQHFLGGPDAYAFDEERGIVSGHPYQYKLWFWSVITYQRLQMSQVLWRQKRKMPVEEINGIWYGIQLGEDAKKVVAYYPQSTARGVLTEACFPLFDLEDELADSCYIGDLYYGETPLRAPIHDSLLLEVPTRKVDRLIERVAYAMQRPVEALPCPEAWGIGPHLTIGVDAKIGPDWGSMEKLALPTWAEIGVSGDTPYTPAEDEDEGEVADWETPMGVSA